MNYEVLIRNGDFLGAERSLVKLLSEEPNNAKYNFSLGVVYAILRNFSQAKFYLKIALNIEPTNAEILNNLGNVLCELHEINEALNCFSLAIKLSITSNASLYFNRGRAYHINMNYPEAINDYKIALKVSPDFIDAKNNLSLCYIMIGDLKSAEIILKNLSKKYPQQIIYHLNLAHVYLNINDKINCIYHYKKALDLDPENFINYLSIANAYNHFNELAEALNCYNHSIILNPNHTDSYISRGNLYNKLNLFTESISDFSKAASMDPANVLAFYNLGCTYLEIKDTENALINFNIVISKDQNHYNALFNKGLVLLLSGNYLDGWKFYEYRFNCNPLPHFNFQINKPLLTSCDYLNGKKLLIYCEQGFGDIIQFIRFIKHIKKMYDTYIILLAPNELRLLFDNIEYVDTVITNHSDSIEYDYVCPLISLPFLLEIELKDIDNEKYLFANLHKIEYWRNRIKNQDNKLNVGIVWRGTHSNRKIDNQRQMPLILLLSYLPKGLNYHCIQKELSDQELSLLSENYISIYTDYLVDFSDTAALCCNLDLIITIDTSVAHLVGALGIKTYLLLSTSSDWRWHLEGTESLWYKSIKIFRQKKVEYWNDPLINIREELLKLV